MDVFPRRRAIAALAGAGAGALALPGMAHAAGGSQTLNFTTRRRSITLPGVPSLGFAFSIDLELFDTSGTMIGTGSVNSMVVELVLGPPPTIVTHDQPIFRLAGGEIHCSTMHERTVPNHGVQFPVAVLGGTGAYRGAGGDGTLEYTTADVTTIVLNLM
jgi:hypothetical protein